MRTLFALVTVFSVAVSGSEPAQTSSELYRSLEVLYAQVVEEFLEGPGVCSSGGPELQIAQAALGEKLPEATARTGPRVLLFAVAANELADVRRLNEAGASQEGDNGSLLHVAARLGDPTMLKYLADIGFWVDEFGDAGGTPLMVAIAADQIDNVKWLIQHGADVNAMDASGATALRHALPCEDQELVNFLLQSGAAADQKTHEIAEIHGLSLKGE